MIKTVKNLRTTALTGHRSSRKVDQCSDKNTANGQLSKKNVLSGIRSCAKLNLEIFRTLIGF